MKICFTFLMLSCITFSSVQGQEFKKFRVGVGLGYAKAGGPGAGGGTMWDIEPGYRLNDRIIANLRFELATVVRGAVDSGVGFTEAHVGSMGFNGQYNLAFRSLRPFMGFGFGFYQIIINMNDPLIGGPSTDGTDLRFGFYPRVGVDIGHFTFSVDYNFIPRTQATVPYSGRFVTTDFKNNYVGLRLGGYFGGGRKQPFKNALLQ